MNERINKPMEPVAVVHNTDTPSNWSIIKPGLPAGTELYAEPVDAKAIRAASEALQCAEARLEELGEDALVGKCAAAIDEAYDKGCADGINIVSTRAALAARQMRDAAVKVCNPSKLIDTPTEVEKAAIRKVEKAIAALPIIGEDEEKQL